MPRVCVVFCRLGRIANVVIVSTHLQFLCVPGVQSVYDVPEAAERNLT
jgi:hypothetical protein